MRLTHFRQMRTQKQAGEACFFCAHGFGSAEPAAAPAASDNKKSDKNICIIEKMLYITLHLALKLETTKGKFCEN